MTGPDDQLIELETEEHWGSMGEGVAREMLGE